MFAPSTSNTTNESNAESFLEKKWKKCQNEELCDVVMIVGNEGKRIPAHRFVLSEESEFFKECLPKEIPLPNVNGEMLQRLVEYCYKGKLLINEYNVEELLKTAHTLRFRQVVMKCTNFLLERLDPNNCLNTLVLAEKYGCKLLHQKTKKYLRTFLLENFMKVCETKEFLRLSVEKLSQFLASDELCVTTEEDVFNSLNKWMQHHPTKREQYKANLLKLVRMPFLEPKFLIQHIKPICTSFESLQVYTEAIACHLQSEGNMCNKAILIKPRRYQVWMELASYLGIEKICFRYYYPQRHKLKQWSRELDYRIAIGRVLMEDCLYIIGGKDAKGNILNTVICINLNKMTLMEIAPMAACRAHFRAAELNGFLYVVGGYNESNEISTVERWNVGTNVWYKVADMSVERANTGVIALNKKLYVVGGFSNGKDVNTAEVYDPAKKVWQNIAPMGEARQSPGVAIANGLLYAVGGRQTKTAEQYDSRTNKWTSICNISKQLCPDDSCFTVNDKVVVCSVDGIEEYDAASDKWKKITSPKFPEKFVPNFLYSGKLLTSQFNEI